MPAKLKSWPRPHFEAGGGNALLYFVVFGKFDLSEPLSAKKYRSDGMGDWLHLTHQTRAKEAAAIAAHQSGKLWEIVTRDAPVTAAEALTAPEAVVVRGEATDPPTLDYFRDAIGVVTYLLDRGGVSVYDPQRFWLWSGDEWRSEIFEPGEPRPQEHTVILVSDDEGSERTQWLHTRGLRQYGRPDLSVRGVGPNHMDAVTHMIERFIEMQAYGGVVGEGQEVRMRGLPPGGVCHHRGSVDDPDFNNVHIAIEWEGGALAR